MSVSVASRAKKQTELTKVKHPTDASTGVQSSVIMEEEDYIKESGDRMSSRISGMCPILGMWTEAVIEKGAVRDGKWGIELSLQLRFDDSAVEPNWAVNGKTIYTKISLNPKSKILRDFCRFLHRRKILEFGEEYQKQGKDGSRGLMAERLKSNLDDICGVWDPDAKELIGGKLAGHRVSVIVSSMVEWPVSSKFPNNYVHIVNIPEEANEGKSVVYSIFEISRLSAHVKGLEYVGSEKNDESAPYYEDPDDDVPF